MYRNDKLKDALSFIAGHKIYLRPGTSEISFGKPSSSVDENYVDLEVHNICYEALQRINDLEKGIELINDLAKQRI